jgi:hypothetical protein
MRRPVEGAGTLASPKEEDRFDLVKSMLAWLAVSSSQKGVIWWASHHREHHRYSDQPEDVHSPVQRGLWWARMGWIFAPLKALSWMGVIWDVRTPPRHVLEQGSRQAASLRESASV